MIVLSDGEHVIKVETSTTIVLNPKDVGLSMIGGNDLYDLGLRVKNLDKNGLTIRNVKDQL